MSRGSRSGAWEGAFGSYRVLWDLSAPRPREPRLADSTFSSHKFVPAVRSPAGRTKWRKRERTVSTPGRPGPSRSVPSPLPQLCRPTPHLLSRPASAPRHHHQGHPVANSRCSLASPTLSHATAQVLTAALLRGGSCNGLLFVFVPAPEWFDGSCLHTRGSLSLPLLEVTQPAPCPRMAVPGYFLASPQPLVRPFSASSVGIIPKVP